MMIGLSNLLGNKATNMGSYMLLMDDISKESCKQVIEWIMRANFEEEQPESLNLMICSDGGDLSAAMAVIDVMRGSSIPVNTIGLGTIASAGLLIFMAGAKGKRVLTPNTSILSHQYSYGGVGKHHELIARNKEYDLTWKRLVNSYKKYTNLSEKEILEKLLPSHDIWLDAKQALSYGICDVVKELK